MQMNLLKCPIANANLENDENNLFLGLNNDKSCPTHILPGVYQGLVNFHVKCTLNLQLNCVFSENSEKCHPKLGH